MEEPQRRQISAAADLPPAASASIASSSSSSSSSNLRYLLTVRQEEDLQPPQQRASLSLGTALACEKRTLSLPGLAADAAASAANPAGGSRTLFDIIREEESAGGGRRSFDDGVVIAGGGHKISWRAFKDALRIRRAGAAWQSTSSAGGDSSVPDIVISSPTALGNTLRRGLTLHRGISVPELNPSAAVLSGVEVARPPTPAPSAMTGLQCAAVPAAEQEQGGSNPDAAAGPATATSENAQQQQPQPIRVSLMALLEQTDRQGEGPGFAVSALLEAAGEADAEEEEDEEEGGEGEGGKMYVKCCVCMVRHKGAAFIPCGHTFCRLCSRELWVSRGNCPLCNGFILEILDIF